VCSSDLPGRRLPVRLLPQAPPLPPGCEGAGKPHVDELFEHRWRKAHEVRALERESRHAKSQVGGGGGVSCCATLQHSRHAQHGNCNCWLHQ